MLYIVYYIPIPILDFLVYLAKEQIFKFLNFFVLGAYEKVLWAVAIQISIIHTSNPHFDCKLFL